MLKTHGYNLASRLFGIYKFHCQTDHADDSRKHAQEIGIFYVWLDTLVAKLGQKYENFSTMLHMTA